MSIVDGEPCVIASGLHPIPKLCANTWDSMTVEVMMPSVINNYYSYIRTYI